MFPDGHSSRSRGKAWGPDVQPKENESSKQKRDRYGGLLMHCRDLTAAGAAGASAEVRPLPPGVPSPQTKLHHPTTRALEAPRLGSALFAWSSIPCAMVAPRADCLLSPALTFVLIPSADTITVTVHGHTPGRRHNHRPRGLDAAPSPTPHRGVANGSRLDFFSVPANLSSGFWKATPGGTLTAIASASAVAETGCAVETYASPHPRSGPG